MVRPYLAVSCCWFRSPHACGDGPCLSGMTWPPRRFSPRVWGWSELERVSHRHQRRFSPRVWGWSGNDSAHRLRADQLDLFFATASRTPPWLASEWGCRGRRLSRGQPTIIAETLTDESFAIPYA